MSEISHLAKLFGGSAQGFTIRCNKLEAAEVTKILRRLQHHHKPNITVEIVD